MRNWVNIIKHAFRRKAIVLMYHSISEATSDPWQICVQPRNFEQHLEVLGKIKKISASNLINDLTTKSLNNGTICITFDDGYCDNFLMARPLLEKYDCPASFFIASDYVKAQKQFWWDELQDIIFEAAVLPGKIQLTCNRVPFEFNLEEHAIISEEQRTQQNRWVWNTVPPTKRCTLYMQLWSFLRPLSVEELTHCLNEIKIWAAQNHNWSREHFPMSAIQLAELSSHSLFEVGLHTASHAALGFHSAEVQAKEISDNETYLKNHCAAVLPAITFPYGNYNSATLAVLEQQKIKAAFTTEEGIVTNRTNKYRIGRFQVKNWTGDVFEKNLRLWMAGF